LFSTKINEHFLQPYHDENKLHVNDMTMMSTLRLHYKSNTVSLIFIVLVHWNNSLQVDMSLHSDTLFWFRANQSLFLLRNTLCSAEKQQIPILRFLIWPEKSSNPQSSALDTSTLTNTPPMQLVLHYKEPPRSKTDSLYIQLCYLSNAVHLKINTIIL
jgi:hypothetical protein